MPGGFGARLRERREAQAIPLTAIAEQTKIKRSLLEALERDDLSQWPSGIFRRAWLRTYAQAINLDPDVTVREFLEEHPDPEEIARLAALTAAAEAAAAQSAQASQGVRGIFGAAFSTLTRRMRGPQVEESPEVPPVDKTDRTGEAETPLAVRRRAELPSPPPPKAEVSSPPPPKAEVTSPPPQPQKSASAPAPAPPAVPPEFDLPAVARLCTKLGQVSSAKDVQPLLQEAATILDATGMIVWLWQSTNSVLRPALVHGYSASVIGRLPGVTRDSDNPTAESFRSGQVREVDGGGRACGALVVPLLLRSRCVGVLAIELEPGRRLSDSGRAVATILAAALAQLVGRSQPAETKTSAKSARRHRLSPVQGAV